ncbi:flagellar hook-length control protein FliK [Parvibaculum sp.]|uniref:flagellar hook-length control protein FliK n=1 Tax=Parvibaculum sp. TaxID=2024848 RepID=UPI0032110569
MGLPSAINLRIAQVDPATLIPAASRTNDNSGAFEQHLDATDTPAARAAERRDDQRQRDSADTAKASAQDSRSPSNAGEDANPATASTASADATVTPTTASTTADEAAAADANAAATAGTEAATPTASDAETTTTAIEAGLADARAASTGEAGKEAKPHDDEAEEKNKAPDQANDTSLAALLMAQPAPLRQTPASNAAPVSTEVAAAASNAATTQQPAAPEHSTLAEAAAQSAMGDAQPDASGDAGATGSETDLAVKSKLEGLGHQAAASMADKSADRQAAAQGAQPAPAQATNPQAVAAAPAAPNMTAATNTGSDNAGTQPISATSGALAAQLSDVQGANTPQQSNASNATIRIGTLPGQTTPSIVPSMAIALQIARNVQKGINRFDIRLDPPELGRIDVRMEVQRDGHVAAHLTVESAQTLDLLQRDQRALQQALTDAGLQANSDSLSFSLRDQNAGGNAQGSAGNSGGGSGSEIAPVEETTASSGPIYNLNLSASGGVDIRV